jgi:hypothetical protein
MKRACSLRQKSDEEICLTIRSDSQSEGKNISDKLTGSQDNAPEGLSGHMLAILDKANGKDISLGTIISTISGQGHAVLLIFLSFSLCISLGIPVLSTILGLALALVGFLMAIGHDVWMPQSIERRVVPYASLSHVIERLIRTSKRIERWFHPRMQFFATSGRMLRIHGVFVMVLGLTAALPLPLPFNNFVAAFPILLLGFSLLELDGALVITSYVAAIPFVLYYTALVYLGHAGFKRLMGF